MTGTHTASPKPNKALFKGTVMLKSFAPMSRAHSRAVSRRTAYRPFPAAKRICRPLPPLGVRRQPAMPSVRSSAMDLPFLTRLNTVPNDTVFPCIIFSATARCRSLIWPSRYSARSLLHQAGEFSGKSSRISPSEVFFLTRGGSFRIAQFMSGFHKIKSATAAGRHWDS